MTVLKVGSGRTPAAKTPGHRSRMDDSRPASERNAHRFGATYLALKLGAILLRSSQYLQKVEIARQLKQLPETVQKREIRIPSRERGRTIRVVVFETPGPAPPAGTQKRKKVAAHLNLHGSGFVIPSLGTDSEFCGRLCGAASTPDRPLIVLDCDYRKSPEHPFPAALEDVEDAVRFVLDYSVPVKDDVEVDLDDEYGFGDVEFDEKRISVSGFSAGGNLALSISSSGSPTVPRPDASGSTKQSPFRAVCAFYASPDLSKPHVAPSKSFDGGLVVPAILRAFFYKCLLAGGRPAPTPSGGGPAVEQTKDPRLSVTFSDTANFPRHVYLACGQADSLHDPGQALVGRLVKEGHPDATFTSVEREAHAFDKNAKAGSETVRRKLKVYDEAIATIKRANADAA